MPVNQSVCWFVFQFIGYYKLVSGRISIMLTKFISAVLIHFEPPYSVASFIDFIPRK